MPPPPPKPEPSPEYVGLMVRLRAEQERRDYHDMISKSSIDEITEMHEEDNISPSLVLNILLSVVFCAGAVFHITRFWRNDGVRVLVSLAAAVVMGVAEVVVYSAYLRKLKEGKAREKSVKERKAFIGDTKGEEDAAHMVDVNDGKGQKEEIWGRGVNGGMRRRVQEKWRKEQENGLGKDW